jgi:acetylornithine deacetylase/succinyl-diaminopimelate desuccinylase-like protein
MTGRTLALLFFASLLVAARQPYPSKFNPGIAQQPRVAAALKYVDDHRGAQLEEWVRLTEIPAPSKMEQRRAAYIKLEMEKAGLADVHLDEIGNCVGTRKGAGGGPTVVFAAHMDTVHPAETPLKVRRDGRVLRAPGVFDNSASCANMLAAIRAMKSAGVQTRGDLVFIATVQEELGLRGMRHWLERNRGRTDMLIALDGGLESVSYGALGIRWVKFVYTSPGSHTNTSRGKPNPAKAVAQAIQNIYTIPLPTPGGESSGIYNVGIIGGGKVVNAISQESFFTVDIRSNDPAVLRSLSDQITRFAEEAAKAERVGFKIEMIQDNPAGGTATQLATRRAHPLVQTAVDILTHLSVNQGQPVRAIASGSTDANIGVEMGIPAIAVGRAHGGDQHTLQEWSEIDSAYLGTKQIILLAVSLAEMADK